MQPRPLYQVLASLVEARKTCIERGNHEWRENHERRMDLLCHTCIPSGAGLDAIPALDLDRSTGELLVFIRCDFRHMNANGYYDGWTEHEVRVRPSLQFGCVVKVTGRDRNDIKDYIGECFADALLTPIED